MSPTYSVSSTFVAADSFTWVLEFRYQEMELICGGKSVEEKSLVTIPAIEKERVCVLGIERKKERETALQTVRGNYSILKKIVHLK